MIIRRTFIFICTILCANVLLAEDFYSGEVKYTTGSNNTVSVTGYDASTLPENLEIPKTVTNEETGISYTVTAIGESAFYYCQDLIAISIPNTVTSIGDNAFKNTPLVSITFEENSNLLTIGSYAFQYCSSLASIIIPKSVTSFGSYAFGSCSALSTVTFEEDSELTTIWGSAFSSCISLTSIIIPKKVTAVKSYAFSGCSSLTSVTFLPVAAPSLTNIWSVFPSNPNTKTLTVPFGSDYSAWESHTTWGRVIYKTNVGETKKL